MYNLSGTMEISHVMVVSSPVANFKGKSVDPVGNFSGAEKCNINLNKSHKLQISFQAFVLCQMPLQLVK